MRCKGWKCFSVGQAFFFLAVQSAKQRRVWLRRHSPRFWSISLAGGCHCVLLATLRGVFSSSSPLSGNRSTPHKARGGKACRLVACMLALNVPAFSTRILCPQGSGALPDGYAVTQQCLLSHLWLLTCVINHLAYSHVATVLIFAISCFAVCQMLILGPNRLRCNQFYPY